MKSDEPRIAAEYQKWCKTKHASSPHLPRLFQLAQECDTCVELGCKNGASATALLAGCKGDVWSYDILPTSRALAMREWAGDRWHYVCPQDTRTADIPHCGLCFVDAMHQYDHVRTELTRHADKVSRYLVFHDTITFGSVGAVDESGKAVPGILGIRPAIDELMLRDRSWFLVRHDYHSHGLLVLQRRLDWLRNGAQV